MARAWKLGDNVNTDEIIPGRYNVTTDRQRLAEHCLCEVRPDFPTGVRQGDVIVGGNNFGCGSSREHAPVAIKAAGVGAVIAGSFARIFFRNAVNLGLPILVSPEASAAISEGDEVEVTLETGIITDKTTGQTFQSMPLPDFCLAIAEAGDVISFIKKNGGLRIK
jgi:3-isopropylmalate/(R)-2-methylmalate dehydratase small subunit